MFWKIVILLVIVRTDKSSGALLMWIVSSVSILRDFSFKDFLLGSHQKKKCRKMKLCIFLWNFVGRIGAGYFKLWIGNLTRIRGSGYWTEMGYNLGLWHLVSFSFSWQPWSVALGQSLLATVVVTSHQFGGQSVHLGLGSAQRQFRNDTTTLFKSFSN